jgi:hypothetical protein
LKRASKSWKTKKEKDAGLFQFNSLLTEAYNLRFRKPSESLASLIGWFKDQRLWFEIGRDIVL